MATRAEIDALLKVACPHCGAAPDEWCSVRDRTADKHRGTRRFRPIPVTTLDGGCHDARWRAAVGRSAAVIVSDALGHQTPSPDPADASLAPFRDPVAVGVDRPW